jgi:hypothetical protein
VNEEEHSLQQDFEDKSVQHLIFWERLEGWLFMFVDHLGVDTGIDNRGPSLGIPMNEWFLVELLRLGRRIGVGVEELSREEPLIDAAVVNLKGRAEE